MRVRASSGGTQPNGPVARRMDVRTFRRLLAVLLIAVATTLGLVVATTGPAAACDCVGLTAAQAARSADAVFTGELVDATTSKARQITTYTFAVERVYGGEVPAVVDVRSAQFGASCGLENMKTERRYVVFAVAADDRLTAGLCGGTQRAGASAVDQVERTLGAGTVPEAAAAPRPDARGSDSSDSADRDGGVQTWMVVVSGAAGAMILAGLLAGAVRLRRQAREIS